MTTPSPTLKPIYTFDPTQPALLHDQLNDEMMPWTAEQLTSWREYANSAQQGRDRMGRLAVGWVVRTARG